MKCLKKERRTIFDIFRINDCPVQNYWESIFIGYHKLIIFHIYECIYLYENEYLVIESIVSKLLLMPLEFLLLDEWEYIVAFDLLALLIDDSDSDGDKFIIVFHNTKCIIQKV